MASNFILASSSAVRLEMLKKIHLHPMEVVPSNINEDPLKKETPIALSIRLAKEKGLYVSKMRENNIILSADTVVCTGRRIIDKCNTKEDVINALKVLSGKNHKVFTTVCVTKNGVQRHKTAEVRVKFKRLSDFEINHYANLGEGIGKAGGYNILGYAECFIIKIIGQYSAISGLPLLETKALLE